MRIIEEDGKARIEGLPEGSAVLFFAKVDGADLGVRLGTVDYCVVFGPKEKCVVKQGNYRELFDAQVGICKAGRPLQILPVRHGHKYKTGGGFVEFSSNFFQIFFCLKSDEHPSTIEGRPIKPENVYIAI